jgi:hypothetical protein
LLPTSVVVYGSMAGFDDRLVAARKAINNAQTSLDGSRERRQELEDAWRKLDDLQDGVREILDCARYIRTEARYRKALPHFLAALVLVLLGVVSSGIVTGAAARERTQKLQAASTQRPKAVSFDQATLVRVYFSHKTTPIGADGPNHCRLWDGIYARAVGGDFDRPLLLFAGYAPDDPLRTQLSKREVMRCSTPWTWAGQSGDVILVPR